MFVAEAAFRFKDESGQCILVHVLSAQCTKVRRVHLLGRIEEQFPCDALEDFRCVSLQRFQHKPDHHCAAFDVVCAGAESEIAFDQPAEIISCFFFRRENRVEMRDERDAFGVTPAPRENEVLAEAWICRRNHFCAEAERCKAFSRESREPVHAFRIQCEAVDADHLPEQIERIWKLRFEEGFQMCGVRHRLSAAHFLTDSTCLPRICLVLKSQSSQSSSGTNLLSLLSHFFGSSRFNFSMKGNNGRRGGNCFSC